MSGWLPALAAALGAKAPRHVPLWLARLIAGKGMVMMADGSRGASNAEATRVDAALPQLAAGLPGRLQVLTAGRGHRQ